MQMGHDVNGKLFLGDILNSFRNEKVQLQNSKVPLPKFTANGLRSESRLS